VRVGWVWDLVLCSVDRCGVGEVEDRDLVPLRRHLLPAQRAGGLHVLLERVEVTDGGWVQHGRAKVDLGERILRVSPGRAATGEERLQRLRRELDDRVALDDARPAALELQVARSEHAESHDALVTITYPCLAPVRSGSPSRITARYARSRRRCRDARGGFAPRSRWHGHARWPAGSTDRAPASGKQAS